jgi:hypothetical protein
MSPHYANIVERQKELRMRTSNTNRTNEYLLATLTYAAAFAVLGYALFAKLTGF